MSFSDDVYELLQTSARIADVRVGNMPAGSNMDPLVRWRDEVIARFDQNDVKQALDTAFSELEESEGGREIARYLRQEINAVHDFQASLLDMKDGRTSGQVSQGQVSQGQVSQGQVSQGQVSQGQDSQGQDSQGQGRGKGRPLQSGLKMAQTVFGSLKDILDLDKRGKALLVIMEEIWGIFAA